MNASISRGLWAVGAVSSVMIALVSYRYFIPSIPEPSNVTGNLMARPWLLVHAGLAATALLTGPWQFLPRLRARAPRLHRWLGRIYIFSCVVGGTGGLLLASGATAGPIARAGFGLLAVVWLVVNLQGLRLAMTGRYAEHRQWMIRSFALTFGAVLLRVYIPISQMMGIEFMTAYRAISWLAWVPNLIVAELYLRSPPRRKPVPAAA
ncbi:MAG TPA: DUF2306 domain-containing protein [Phenylobacterium sp.]|jgi:uncharacterized membrane protein|uniref:DUF2306 domain-containing protein n=1 Tax=Phenylobacterium sp. TaxID=1871053 RepID=UPI002D3F6498|nr:DUF2306 domain-containing protein [Phenylobacterium sp.]HZZ67046.1 DUF2306 domain-containing protein [Phenylobacterium sp.]